MARPAKNAQTNTGKVSKAEKTARKVTEKKLRGGQTKIKPPDYLTDRQQDIFKYIVNELKRAGIIGNLDVFVLEIAAVSIDRIQDIEDQINKNPGLLESTKMMGAKEKYSKDFFRVCNELSLSPQARAKISIANVNAVMEAKKKNPLLEALGDN